MSEPTLNRFSRRLLASVAKRFMDQCAVINGVAALARTAMLCEFSDHELHALFTAGYLSSNDCVAIRIAGRADPRSWTALEAPSAQGENDGE